MSRILGADYLRGRVAEASRIPAFVSRMSVDRVADGVAGPICDTHHTRRVCVSHMARCPVKEPEKFRTFRPRQPSSRPFSGYNALPAGSTGRAHESHGVRGVRYICRDRTARPGAVLPAIEGFCGEGWALK